MGKKGREPTVRASSRSTDAGIFLGVLLPVVLTVAYLFVAATPGDVKELKQHDTPQKQQHKAKPSATESCSSNGLFVARSTIAGAGNGVFTRGGMQQNGWCCIYHGFQKPRPESLVTRVGFEPTRPNP